MRDGECRPSATLGRFSEEGASGGIGPIEPLPVLARPVSVPLMIDRVGGLWMRLPSWCALSAVVLLGVGMTPIAFVQLELATPGVQIFEGQWKLFNAAVVGHGYILAACLPLAVAALGFAITGEARKSGSWMWISALVLGFSLLSAIAFVAVTAFGTTVSNGLADLALIPSTLVLLLSAMVVAATFKATRAVPLFLWLSIPAFAGAAIFMMVLHNSGVNAVLHDTYYALAPTHALGVAVILLTLAIATAYVGRNTNSPGGWFGGLFGALIVAAGAVSVLLTARLGLVGSVRRYFDYPEAFAVGQLELSISSSVLVFVTAAAFACLAFTHLMRRGDNQVRVPQ
jgi:heme/copper-type cytochrome/quinol oxidase subunit 1